MKKLTFERCYQENINFVFWKVVTTAYPDVNFEEGHKDSQQFWGIPDKSWKDIYKVSPYLMETGHWEELDEWAASEIISFLLKKLGLSEDEYYDDEDTSSRIDSENLIVDDLNDEEIEQIANTILKVTIKNAEEFEAEQFYGSLKEVINENKQVATVTTS